MLYYFPLNLLSTWSALTVCWHYESVCFHSAQCGEGGIESVTGAITQYGTQEGLGLNCEKQRGSGKGEGLCFLEGIKPYVGVF